MSTLGRIAPVGSRFGAKYGSKPGKWLGTFDSREQAQKAIDDYLRATHAHVLRVSCSDCGVVFFVRNKPGESKRERCRSCQQARYHDQCHISMSHWQ